VEATWWPAPAKLNLFLHVVGRRPDGRHLLQTVFQFLDLCDCLAFEVTPAGGIRRARPVPGVAEEADLCLRAARLLGARAGVRRGVVIHLDKRLPLGGGLGGGSSDAATTLHALNRLWGLGLPADELAALGLELGADVPVFVRGQAAWAEGVGERLEPVALPEPWYVVVAPPVPVSTARIFQAFSAQPRLTGYRAPITIRDFRAGRCGNDLEAVACGLHPEVAQALAWLGRQGTAAGPARMTGSGACVFLPVADRASGRRIVEALPDAWTGFLARGRNRSPLLDHLQDPGEAPRRGATPS